MELKTVVLPEVNSAANAQNTGNIQMEQQAYPDDSLMLFDFEMIPPEGLFMPLEQEEISSEHFITANTEPILLEDLRNRCIIPVFSKDNESTISHPEFINMVAEIGSTFISGERMLKPAIRVSHPR